ncbi:MAG: cytochrome c-550 [Spirulinaceae cyanobacterium RM2_2_10]|nr:cytochrome c-550 [Spirulinaceae cyanobacterium SM2_1_0]NJO21528.1 cytochrome c-550 [Spirulinaceae cyanobacterium RM2_2_10]
MRNYLGKLILALILAIVLAWQLLPSAALAIDVAEDIRTVQLNAEGDTYVLSNEQLEQGKLVFVDTCSQCHLGGRTKTNPNVTLSLRDLRGAEPSRDNLLAMADYLQQPTTYDGELDLSELHPNTMRADLYPEMRNLTVDDLKAVSGYILAQPKLRSTWGLGKAYD